MGQSPSRGASWIVEASCVRRCRGAWAPSSRGSSSRGSRSRKAHPLAPPARAKSIILLWMNGGPSHLDTWDPKPGAATGGPFKAIKTRNAALSISEHMPHLADVGDKLTVLRGMASKEGNHQRAQYLMHTGYSPNPTVEHPSLGGWVSSKLGAPKNGLPAFVSLGGPSFGAGFLGVEHGPFVVQKGGTIPDNTPIAGRRRALRAAPIAARQDGVALRANLGRRNGRRSARRLCRSRAHDELEGFDGLRHVERAGRGERRLWR